MNDTEKRRTKRRRKAGKAYGTTDLGNGMVQATPEAVLRAMGGLPPDLEWEVMAPNVIPIIGARTTAQLQDSLQSTGLTLSSDHLTRLHNVSAIEKGFPHDFLARVKELVSSDAQSKLDRKNFTF